MNYSIKERQQRPLVALLYLVLFLIWAGMVKSNANFILSFDHVIQSVLMPLISPRMTKAVSVVSFIGNPKIDLVWFFILAIILFFLRQYRNMIFAIGLIFFGDLFGLIAKHIVHRPRPIDKLVPEHGFSFPSGHVLGTSLLVFMLVFLITKNMQNRNAKLIIEIIGALWIIIIALTRIYLHVHYPSDTIGSIFLAAFTWEAGMIVYYRYLRR